MGTLLLRRFDFVASLPEVDANRIVFGGSSMSGGNVITAVSVDKRISAAIAQVPFVSREDTAPNVLPMMQVIHEDLQNIKSDKPGAMVPCVSASVEEEREGTVSGILSGPGVPEFLQEMENRGIRRETGTTIEETSGIEREATTHGQHHGHLS